MNKVFDIIKPQENLDKKETKKPKNFSWLWFLLTLATLVALLYLGFRYISKYKPINSNTKIEIPERENSISQNAPNAQAASTSDQETKPTEQPSATETKTPEIDKSTISIQILNASGQIGSAAIAQNILLNNGFKLITIDTADSVYNSTVIYYKNSQDKAKMIADTLNDYQTSIEQSNELGDYDIWVIIGQK